MKKPVIILFFLYGISDTHAQSMYPNDVEDRIRQVEQTIGLVKFQIDGKPNVTIEERMAQYGIKGISVAVIHNYKIEWAKGYGWADSSERRLVTSETLFEPGSISKSLNALGALKLVEEKKIDLDEDINIYLKSWKFPYDKATDGKKITVAHLLSHTAGLNVHGFPGYFRGDIFPTLPQILDGKPPANTEAVRSLFVPGLRFEYSGGGTTISQLIQMDITGKLYDHHILQEVFEPLGMSRSSFTQPPPENKRNMLATGYSQNGKEIKGKYPILIEQAAGGLWTTPTDLCKFIIEMQLSLEGKSNKVLSRKMTKKMLTPYKNKVAGFGCFIENRNGTKYFQHGAQNLGFSGQYFGSFKDGNGIAVVVNSDAGQSMISEIINSVARVYHWKGFIPEEEIITKKKIQVDNLVLEKYIGAYKQDNMIITISKGEEDLLYQAGERPWKMYFDSDTTFFNLESGSEKVFYKDTNGVIGGFSRRVKNKDLGKMEKIALMVLPDDLMNTYAGTYMDGKDPVIISKKENYLLVDRGYGTPLVPLYFISDTDFFMSVDFGAQYKFILDASGNVEEVYRTMGKEHTSVKRVK